MPRQARLEEWVSSLFPTEKFTITPASADASFRRYFRAQTADHSYIVMDAPPQHEDCRPFIHVATLFEAAGAHVPHIHAQNLEEGYLLLSDLGDTTYLAALNLDTAKNLYADAVSALIKIQLASKPDKLPPYDRALLERELNLFPDWYINKHLNITLTDKQNAVLRDAFEKILSNNLSQPSVYVHRDYHSRNLMVVEGNNPGVIDFQDAVYGPITYDLASLFKDAYITWDEELVLDWLIRYWEKARKAGLPVNEDFGHFYRDFEWMGVQRHIKVLGIFARLCHRDGKQSYVNDMPLVMQYLQKACERYVELRPFLRLLNELNGQQTQVIYSF